MAADLPGVLTPVTLHLCLADGTNTEVTTPVCDVEDADGTARIVVARPELGATQEVVDLTVRWPLRVGRMRLRVTAASGIRSYGPVWVLTPAGTPVLEQRREFFRVPLTLRAVLTPADAPEAATRATIVEISEGGALVCCLAELPAVGSRVDLAFTLDGRPVVATSEVLRHDVPDDGPSCAAVRFLDPTAYGDHIRRFAFAVERTRARTPLR